MNLTKAIGLAIRNARTERGFTQEDLAESANLHVTAVGRMERGDRLPRLDTLAQVALAFGLPLSQLLRQAEDLKCGS